MSNDLCMNSFTAGGNGFYGRMWKRIVLRNPLYHSHVIPPLKPLHTAEVAQ